MAFGADAYDAAASSVRQPGPTGSRDRELVRLATLAASSHNTQPWLFRTASGSIEILPDRTRRCPVVDLDDAHLYKSVGCARRTSSTPPRGRGSYDRSQVAPDDPTELLGAGTRAGVRCLILIDHSDPVAVTDLVERGDLAQLADDAVREELLS